MWIEVEGKDIFFLRLSFPTPRSKSYFIFESDYGTTTSSLPSITKGYTCDLVNHASSSNFIAWLTIVLCYVGM
jgi:hypothetical protein